MGYAQYNANPYRRLVGDCPVRAISKATGKSWHAVYTALALYGFAMGDMPSANAVWGAYLRKQGFMRQMVDDHGKDFYTVEDFCQDNQNGTFILAINGHVVCVVDGFYYDSWDSGQEVPLYYWTR